MDNSDASILEMPQWDKQDISNLAKVFTMYIKFPKSRWTEIKKAETDNILYDRLHAEFIDTFWGQKKILLIKRLQMLQKGYSNQSFYLKIIILTL